MLKNMRTIDAVFVTLMAACGLALKPIVGPLGKLIGSILFIPGGSISGAVYMIWPMLALLVVRQFGVATLVGLIEGIVVLITGIYGSHGIFSLLTYIIPCVLIDVIFWALKNMKNMLTYFLPPAIGNTGGALMVALFIMHVPLIPLLIGFIPAFIFGGLGGILAFKLYEFLVVTFPQFKK